MFLEKKPLNFSLIYTTWYKEMHECVFLPFSVFYSAITGQKTLLSILADCIWKHRWYSGKKIKNFFIFPQNFTQETLFSVLQLRNLIDKNVYHKF